MINESLNYLRNDEDWVKTVLIGGILSLLGVLIVPTILVAGYLVRVIRRTMHGVEEPPEFDDWGDMAVDGLKAMVIAFIYGFIPALIASVLVGGAIFTMIAGGSAESGGLFAVGSVVALLGLLVPFVLGLVAAYIIPAAIANFAETDQFGKAFSVGDLRSVLVSGKYFTAWVSGFAVIFVAGLVVSILNAIPPLGFIAGGFLGFYAAVAAYYIIGNTWGELHDVEMQEGEGRPDEQAAV
ncbi:DUF4013 domain-containing protein [Halogeometricum borinquense]|uniref:DUF4013 domain-containing protein n=1 Tax=Halogeometricum borinquense TaxID=60847 RepID=A0A6C0UH09_9EURY|nr:DUF4013 domain-containing protein [Halogeometricum borinquense]QIB74772.1 DUF4013 domain-containing protein [Halogeometricum borinquense]QIQ76283.1 DUF4013 domain-containing protein [Halogeometricum borinquense]